MFKDIAKQVEERCKVQEHFFNNVEKGIQFAVKDLDPSEKYFTSDEYVSVLLNWGVKFFYTENNCLPDKKFIYNLVEKVITEHRQKIAKRGLKKDYGVPTFQCHTDSGCKVATVLDKTPEFMNFMFWHDPNLSYEEFMSLELNPDTRWLTFLIDTYEALQHFCEGDYLALPYSHRSPLDLANALRGNDIFLEMYTESEQVKDMINKVVDLEIEIEKTIYERVPYSRQKCRTGQQALVLPDKAVWVNGDPVGLISNEMMIEFEQPTTGRLFTSTGGGFFHNHTIGLRQVPDICNTPGIYVQQIAKDFNVPTFEETMANNQDLREKIIEASKSTVVSPHNINLSDIEELLPHLKGGRFFLLIENDGDEEMLKRVVKAIEKHNASENYDCSVM